MRKIIFLIITLTFSVNSFAIKPVKEYKATPKDYGIQYDEIVVTSGKVKIATWYLKQSQSSAKSVLLCNSDYGNMSFSLPLAAELYKKGYNVILFDYRGFGNSSAFSIDTNMLFYNEFCEDLEHVFQFYTSKSGLKPTIYGQSMGTIIATICYSDKPKVFSSKFIFDSFIEDLEHTKKVLFSFKNRHFKTPVTDAQYRHCILNIKKASVLVFKGSSDNVSFDLQSNLLSPAWTTVNFNGGHMQGAGILGEAYWSAITNYLGH